MNPDTINAFSQAVQGLADKAGAAAVQYGPEALGIAESYVHSMAILSLVGDLVQVAICIALIVAACIIWGQANKMEDDYGDRFGVYVARGAIISAFGALSLGFGISALQDFLSPTTFFGLFEPKIAVLHYALTLTH